MFKHILLPTDGSNLSQAAIQKGVQLAKSTKAKISGISVVPEQKYYLYQTGTRVGVPLTLGEARRAPGLRNPGRRIYATEFMRR